jgi:hypothetical protein
MPGTGKTIKWLAKTRPKTTAQRSSKRYGSAPLEQTLIEVIAPKSQRAASRPKQSRKKPKSVIGGVSSKQIHFSLSYSFPKWSHS